MNEKEAYEFGKDCGINGANTTNCNYKIFAKLINTKVWERGKKAGEIERE